MSIVKYGGAANEAKKHRPILFGSRLLQLRVGPRHRSFSVDEKMLCARSAYFKDRFQKARKIVEGECAICHENLDALTGSLTYCRECGNNHHEHCMEQWTRASSTCPTCRSNWEKLPLPRSADLDEVDEDGFNLYVQWLYSHRIPSYAPDKKHVWLPCHRLISAHTVGDILNDMEFVQIIQKEIVKYIQKVDYTASACVNKAYEITNRPCALRKFVIDLYLFGASKHYVSSLFDKQVLTDLVISLLEWIEEKIVEVYGTPGFRQDIWIRMILALVRTIMRSEEWHCRWRMQRLAGLTDIGGFS